MSGLATLGWALAWLVGLVWLARWPIMTSGSVLALVASSWTPAAFWLALAATALVSVGWRLFGPEERLFWRFPELAVVLGAGMTSVLAGGQVAAGALVVVVLALGQLGRSLHAAPVGPAPAPAAARGGAVPASVGYLSWRVDFGPCPDCGGLLDVEAQARVDPARGRLVAARAVCSVCGLRLVSVYDASTLRGVSWVRAEDREGSS